MDFGVSIAADITDIVREALLAGEDPAATADEEEDEMFVLATKLGEEPCARFALTLSLKAR